MLRVEMTFKNILLLLAMLVVAWVLYRLRDTVVLLGLALMLMATLHPLVKMAERRGLSHSKSVALVMLSLVVVPVAIVAALTPLVISEVQSFANSFPTLQNHLNELLLNWGLATQVNNAIDKLNVQDHIAGIALVSAQQTVTILLKTFSVIVIAGYLLSDSRRLQLMLHEFVPRSSERHIEPLLGGMERVVGGYIRGQLLTSAMFGVFAFVLCLVLRVPNPLLLGIIAAIGDIIPLFGVPLAMLITIVVAFTASVWQPIGVVIGYLVYGQLESHLLVPKIYSRTVNMSPLAVIVATIVGGSLDGFVGIFVGIPVAGALKLILDYIVSERVNGREASSETALTEPMDLIGEENTEEEFGAAPAALADEPPAEGVPEPTYSPFEHIPEQETQLVQKISGARYVTAAHVRTRRHEKGLVVSRHRLRKVDTAAPPGDPSRAGPMHRNGTHDNVS